MKGLQYFVLTNPCLQSWSCPRTVNVRRLTWSTFVKQTCVTRWRWDRDGIRRSQEVKMIPYDSNDCVACKTSTRPQRVLTFRHKRPCWPAGARRRRQSTSRASMRPAEISNWVRWGSCLVRERTLCWKACSSPKWLSSWLVLDFTLRFFPWYWVTLKSSAISGNQYEPFVSQWINESAWIDMNRHESIWINMNHLYRLVPYFCLHHKIPCTLTARRSWLPSSTCSVAGMKRNETEQKRPASCLPGSHSLVKTILQRRMMRWALLSLDSLIFQSWHLTVKVFDLFTAFVHEYAPLGCPGWVDLAFQLMGCFGMLWDVFVLKRVCSRITQGSSRRKSSFGCHELFEFANCKLWRHFGRERSACCTLNYIWFDPYCVMCIVGGLQVWIALLLLNPLIPPHTFTRTLWYVCRCVWAMWALHQLARCHCNALSFSSGACFCIIACKLGFTYNLAWKWSCSEGLLKRYEKTLKRQRLRQHAIEIYWISSALTASKNGARSAARSHLVSAWSHGAIYIRLWMYPRPSTSELLRWEGSARFLGRMSCNKDTF